MKNLIYETLLPPADYTDNTDGTALDLSNIHAGDEEILLSIGAITNIDAAFLIVEESHNGTTLWTRINQFSVLAASAISLLKIRRTKSYIRVRLAIEPQPAVSSSILLSAVFQRDR